MNWLFEGINMKNCFFSLGYKQMTPQRLLWAGFQRDLRLWVHLCMKCLLMYGLKEDTHKEPLEAMFDVK